MSYKNPKELLQAATGLPAAIEARLPAGAPKLSQTLTDAANKLPALPDFPMAIPDLPPVPELPGGGAAALGIKTQPAPQPTRMMPKIGPY